jgi:hypothetical protein
MRDDSSQPGLDLWTFPVFPLLISNIGVGASLQKPSNHFFITSSASFNKTMIQVFLCRRVHFEYGDFPYLFVRDIQKLENSSIGESRKTWTK